MKTGSIAMRTLKTMLKSEKTRDPAGRLREAIENGDIEVHTSAGWNEITQRKETKINRGPVTRELYLKGWDEDTILAAQELLQAHSGFGRGQAAADPEIADHIRSQSKLGQYFRDKAEIEERIWAEQRAAEQRKRREEARAAGRIPENFHEPRVYRKGEMDKDILAFSRDERGPWGGTGWTVKYTIRELRRLGYRPIAGIGQEDTGSTAEKEITFARFPKEY